MWATTVGSDALRRREPGMPTNQWHRGDTHPDDITHATGSVGDSGAHDGPSSSDATNNESGTWGERDVGGFDEHEAMEELEVLRQNLSQLHGTKTQETQASRPFETAGNLSRRHTKQAEAGELDGDEKPGTEEEEFELGRFMRDGHFEKRTEDGSEKRVGVIYKNLNVKGVESTSSFVRTVPDAIIGTFGPDLYRILSHYIPLLRFGRKQPTRTLINDFTGCVRDGEMMLVLGRPGSGCSTFLKAVSNNTESFAAIEGEISYGGIPSGKQKQMYRGEVNYNPEDDIHFASLNVWQTFTFALMNKTKKGAKEEIPIIANALMKMFGISHTKYTLIGDEYIRGVSGGERKRVSIAETLASKSTVMAWDNSTRGLDASTALDYAKSLRIMTDISNRTTLVTLYQAGEGIYELMDKVLVIDQGRQIFSGPARDAKQYFIDLGFECPERQTTADFLTAVTDPNERRFRPGFEDRAPKTAEELEKAFRNSPNYQKLLADVQDYEEHLRSTDYADAKRFEGAVRDSKSKHVNKESPYTVSFTRQVMACTKREFWLLFGDTATLWTKFFIIVANGFIVGSIYYKQPATTAGAFTRGGALFFSIVFLGWLQLSELTKAVSGRTVVSRHRDYAFYRPSAVVVARVIQDIPVIFVQVCIFGVAMYFMTNLDVDVSKFWIYMLFVYTTTLMITSMYRMFASLSPEINTAVRFSSLALNLLVIYTGYVLPKTQLLNDYIWFGWLYWINPMSYSFEAVLTNELSNRIMDCASSQLVPQGQNVLPEFQGCALSGSKPNSRTVAGSDYLATALNYSRSNLWRNFGVVIAFMVLYIIVTVFATEVFDFSSEGGGALIFKKSKRAEEQARKAAAPSDIEKDAGADSSGSSATRVGNSKATADEQKETLEQLTKSESIFTWRDVEYTVPYLGGQRKLLNKVSGYAKPGIMVALMGASGAGKSTLLNTLAQRQRVGVISGEMFVDGRPLGPEFQRNTGFCLQGDLHDKTQTIREAIKFSALLRQEASIPRAEKLAYVDKIIDLLELNDLQDAIIGSLGVELRKRLTIGVELAAKPSLLLFLDEPTSGLDSQSAYSIISFLKKLCAAGQAIVCTIHQPSSVLIQQFDMVLALNPGGNTFYFGPIGENGKDVIKYFSDRGATCPPGKNIAEFILETAARPHKRTDGTKVDWNEEWRNSEQAEKVLEEIDGLKRIRSTVSQGANPTKEQQMEYAASTWLQTVELTKRMFRQYWRDPSYLYGKFFTAIIIGIFNGFTFWKLGYSVQDMQNRMFTIFMIVIIPPTIVNAVVPKFDSNMALWETREYPSRIYGWVAFCTANIVAELPAAVISAVLYWALWCWPTGIANDSFVAGYSFLMTVLVFLFMTSWGQWICAFAPSFTVISNVLPFFFVMFGLFNGVVQPYAMLNVFWRSWMYWANPATYWIGGMVAAGLDGIPVQCDPSETARFDVPQNQTCQTYAGEFARTAGGYLVNPDANSDCQYCQYSVGNQYLTTLNINADDKWRNFGIFLAFCFSNWMLVYFFIYTVRVRGWNFGLNYVFGTLGKFVGVLRKPFKWVSKKE
ncbi:ABC-2 type transporter-domain-containing protein [Annulohypoxylon maeteangense]|uniref:ABC-2 type transporter-domain-containing protein n=1 Tax=Annulohypoxylon maeteangense TaxID=1927788 RepID=UPI0020079A92|nr:ABC-2 type transporter-domain-containing protein [Annulohypoxylon maeteangense]KAI0884215.1 ABC-2 type transporter-domain-containing protein [Annulohypoxylon maeteangense]